ncbi:polysaccharide deacetylase family protein [Agaribacterium haliotis]|uniref:polysaccharide deacetylase family protein n=1 Tax=Agaribacterium haliotis TaxID=2013869 RepID=UPI0011788684|nr:polysaccharide deacetylase family protein [Agaribacterium haliotis]
MKLNDFINGLAYCLPALIFSLLLGLAAKAQALVILQYHHISDSGPASTRISPERFIEHLDSIEARGYTVMPLPEVAKLLRDGKVLPDKSVVLTFDDGYRSIFDKAYPELQKRNMSFTVFVNSQAHDQNLASHMSWDELRTLAANGASIANHSHSHAYVLRRDAKQSAAEFFRAEVAHAEKRIKEEIGYSLKLFAYPFGEYDSQIQAQLKQHNYLAFGQQSGAVANSDSLQALPRFPFGGNYGDNKDFMLKLSTLPFDNMKLEISDEQGRPLKQMQLALEVKKPVLTMSLPKNIPAESLNCFASMQGAANMAVLKENKLRVQAKNDIAIGRSRYNCTARHQSGRFYWWSTTFVRRGQDGSWRHY